jgi:hypothetical protein
MVAPCSGFAGAGHRRLIPSGLVDRSVPGLYGGRDNTPVTLLCRRYTRCHFAWGQLADSGQPEPVPDRRPARPGRSTVAAGRPRQPRAQLCGLLRGVDPAGPRRVRECRAGGFAGILTQGKRMRTYVRQIMH